MLSILLRVIIKTLEQSYVCQDNSLFIVNTERRNKVV